LTTSEEERLANIEYDVTFGCNSKARTWTSDFHLPKAHVSDSQSAIAYATPIFDRIYGQEQMKSEQPLTATLYDSKWVVEGTLPSEMHGGTAMMVIQPKTGEVLCVTHFK